MIMIDTAYTIKPTTRYNNDVAEYLSVSESRARREKDVQHLKDLLPQRQAELIEELRCTYPNMTRVNNLRRIISDLQQTLKMIQR